jgi:Acetyltransferase (GNAT) domain
MSSLSDPDSRDAVTRWLRRSPEHTLYHLEPYIDFLRARSGMADVLLMSCDGNALFALPVHSWNAAGIDGGYSGVVFPTTRSEGSLRRSVAALAALLAQNRHIPFHLIQSAQAPAYDDLARVTLLQQLLESEGLMLDPVYGRLCDLEYLPVPEEIPVTPGRHPGTLMIDRDWLTGEALNAYDPDARNQIRQAIRNGLTVEYVSDRDPSARAGGYARFQPVHVESWRRTGLLPKTPDHWRELSEAIAASGGEDLIVLVLDSEGEPLAGVVCHAYQSRAIYWSGCSSRAGMSSRANSLCLHGAIVAARRQGVRTFELGRFSSGETSRKERSVTAYKSQFGGSLVRITSFSSAPGVVARTRAARAEAISEGKRRLSVALGRACAPPDSRLARLLRRR